MSEPRKEIHTADEPVIETYLTDEEKAIIREGREEYKAGKYVPLSEI